MPQDIRALIVAFNRYLIALLLLILKVTSDTEAPDMFRPRSLLVILISKA